MKTRQMDKQFIQDIREGVQTNLKKFCEANGLEVKTGKASYDSTFVEIKVTFSLLNKDGQAETPEKGALDRFAASYDLQAKYGDEFLHHGESFRVIGLVTTRPKYPVLVLNIAKNKRQLFTVEGVNRCLTNKVSVGGKS